MTVLQSVLPSVSITASATTICAGSSVTFIATPVNGGVSPTFQWKKNGNVIPGATSASYSTSAINNNDFFSVDMTSSSFCTVSPNVSSNSLLISVSPSSAPTLVIAATKTSLCIGQSVTFTASPTNGGSSPAYQWKINGNDVGANSPTYSSVAIANNDLVTCVLTSNSGCASPSTATSIGITMTLSANTVPSVGNTLAAPIVIGSVPCSSSPYTNLVNNADCYTNDFMGTNNQTSPDVFYEFTLTGTETVNIDLCNSGFDTYLHLLDNAGVQIVSNNDSGPSCTGIVSSLSQTLTGGTYYIVAEGFGTGTGMLDLSVSKVCSTSSTLNISAFIEGYYDSSTGLMQSVIANSQFLPPTLECDTLTVELHDATSTLSVPVILETYTGVLATDGSMACTFSSNIDGNSYYIVLKHRNALETWSVIPVLMTSNNSYDFTVQSNIYGNNVKLVASGEYALFSGNMNGDGIIDLTDFAIWETAANAFVFGYETGDLNGDAIVDLIDFAIWEANTNAFVFVYAPF